MSPRIDLERALDAARRAVAAAGEASLRHFRRDVAVETKPDRTPVTAADRAAEAAILAVLSAAFPDHDLLTEESGPLGRGGSARWIVDPLDGTRGFARGGAHWGPLVALEEGGEVLVGAMALPVLGETYWAARGRGAYRDGERLRLSTTAEWGAATLSLGEVGRLLDPPYDSAVADLARTAASARAYGDLASAAMLLGGRADAWLEAGVKVWDVAPLAVLVEEAGGRFTDFAGRRAIESGTVAAANGPLHAHLLERLGASRG